MQRVFALGDRVALRGHWEWQDGVTGTVAEPPDVVRALDARSWIDCRRRTKTRKGIALSYWVRFDSPQDDGSGDGPYAEGEVDAACLEPI